MAGTPGPAHDLRTLREAVFRPGADPAAVERLRDAEQRAERDRLDAEQALAAAGRRSTAAPVSAAPRPSPAVATPARPRRVRRLLPAALVGVVALGIGVGIGSGVTAARPLATPTAPPTPSGQQLVRLGVIESDGELSAGDYYALYPDALPPGWKGAAGVAFPGLRGTAYRGLEPRARSSELLIVVTCPSVARRYRWQLFTADRYLGSGGGRCGTMDPHRVVLGEGHPAGMTVRVWTSRPEGYALAEFER